MVKKTRKVQSVGSKVITKDILQYIIDDEIERLKRIQLTAYELLPTATTLPYNSAKVFAYAQSWCGGGNDCPDGSFDLDCTHFLCHCLAATGVAVTNPSAKCRKGLCIRVNDLAAAFNNAVGQFTNIKRINSHAETRRGDFCFLPGWFGLKKEHGMLLAGQSNSTSAIVYAHTNNRCGSLVDFGTEPSAFYRIEDA